MWSNLLIAVFGRMPIPATVGTAIAANSRPAATAMVISRATVVALARRSEVSTGSGYAGAAAAGSGPEKPQAGGVRVIAILAECQSRRGRSQRRVTSTSAAYIPGGLSVKWA